MIAFTALGLVAVAAGVLVVASRNPVIGALWLALTLAAVAGMFAVLGAEFLAAVQLIIYAGAILVFVLFVIMLLGVGPLPPGDRHPVQRWLGLYLAAVIGVVLAFAVWASAGRLGESGGIAPAALAAAGDTAAIASVLFSRYIFPFEIASLLLTAAVVGAVVLSRRPEPGQPMIPSAYVLLVSAALFATGVAGVLVRRNAIVVFMSIELMLNAANLALVGLARELHGLDGEVFVFFVLAVAAAEAAIGLALVIAVFRHRPSVDLDAFTLLKW